MCNNHSNLYHNIHNVHLIVSCGVVVALTTVSKDHVE